MRAAYIGNFGAPHSTENHVARALENNGVAVNRLQEKPSAWATMADNVQDVDFVLWTTTYDYAPPETFNDQRGFLREMGRRGLPVVGYHLDRWWGLQREHRVTESPFFRCDLVCTADGGHEAEFAAAGVVHEWFPPAVSRDEAELGTPRDEYRSDIAFVGSWTGGYHPEWPHRRELVRWLGKTYGDRCRFWPKRDQPAIRGKDLQDLYASTKVIVGDSCLAGGATHYWSDRIPETMGRGGYLLHPEVEGLDEQFTITTGFWTWPIGDWDRLKSKIGHYLTDTSARQQIAAALRAETLERHTYEVRTLTLIDLMKNLGML